MTNLVTDRDLAVSIAEDSFFYVIKSDGTADWKATLALLRTEILGAEAAVVMEADYNAHTILAATVDDTPAALTVAEQTLVGRITAGNIAALTATQVRTLLNVEDGADVTDATNVAAAGAVMEADTSTALMSFVVDEDNMASNSATKVPTQQSVKAYADTLAAAVEGTAIKSTGEAGGSKFLREDGDGTSSWQTVAVGTGDLKADGTVPLTADWDAGSFEIRAQTFESDVVTGTAPIVIASTTVCTNLNADLLDGNEASAFATSGHNHDSAYISIVGTPTNGNFPQLTAGGELVNSVYDETSFATAAHAHEGTAILSTGEVGGSKFLREDGDGTSSWQSVPAAGLSNVVEDTTPQLGGSLDVNGQKIVSVSNGAIDIEPHGTGNVLLGNFTFDADQTVGAGQDNYVFTYDNATGLISLEAAAGGGGDFKADGSVDMTGQFRTDVGTFDSDVVDGASANAYTFDTQNTYSTAGANLLRLSNNADVMMDFSYQGGIDHVNSGASTAAHSQSLNLNWSASSTQTSSGQYSSVIGYGNLASARTAHAVGYENSASATEAVALGKQNTVSGASSFACGSGHTLSGADAASFGIHTLSSLETTITLGCGRFTTSQPAQTSWSTVKAATTDATQTDMLMGTTGSARLTIPADTSWAFSALVIARSDETDGNVSAAWKAEGVLYRDESNNTVIQGVTVTNIYSGFSTAAVAVAADDTNEALAIKVTGEAATNIRWVAKVDIAQVTYA